MSGPSPRSDGTGRSAPERDIASMPDNAGGLVLLKLGGALITDKSGVESPRLDVIARLASEIAAWPGASAGRLVVTHGSGSFAHRAVIESGFQRRPSDRLAFARVAASAARLNALVIEALIDAGLPAISIPGGLVARCRAGAVVGVRTGAIERSLRAGLLPTTYGDSALDPEHGGAIASTDAIVRALAAALRPRRVVMATDVDGIYAVDPKRDPGARRIERLTPVNAAEIRSLGDAPGVLDVSGGMSAKVDALLALVADPGIEARVFSGHRPGALTAALAGDPSAGGTIVISSAADPESPRRTS